MLLEPAAAVLRCVMPCSAPRSGMSHHHAGLFVQTVTHTAVSWAAHSSLPCGPVTRPGNPPAAPAALPAVRVMAGKSLGVDGPIKLRNPGMLLDVRLAPGANFSQVR